MALSVGLLAFVAPPIFFVPFQKRLHSLLEARVYARLAGRDLVTPIHEFAGFRPVWFSASRPALRGFRVDDFLLYADSSLESSTPPPSPLTSSDQQKAKGDPPGQGNPFGLPPELLIHRHPRAHEFRQIQIDDRRRRNCSLERLSSEENSLCVA